MGATFTELRDEIGLFFRTGWLAIPASAAVPIRWEDVQEDTPNLGPMVEFRVQHQSGGQSTLATDLVKFARSGQVTVTIYTMTGGGLTQNDELCQIATGIFEGRTPGRAIWFSQVTANEGGIIDGRFLSTVTAVFNYHEAK